MFCVIPLKSKHHQRSLHSGVYIPISNIPTNPCDCPNRTTFAPRHTEQLASVREEFESFKESSGRWQTDAKAKWRQLERASDSAMNEAKTCRQAGDAAERELATLKAAFRSFLKTLWEDMRHRPASLATFTSTRPSPARRETGAEERIDPNRLVPSATGDGTAISRAGPSALVPTGLVVAKAEDGQRGVAGVADANHGVKTSEDPFAELTEAEVSDIMLALSGDSYSHSCSDRVTAPPAPPDVIDPVPVTQTQLLQSCRGAAPTSPPLDREFEEEEAFSARIELALGGQNTSAALADMLRSFHTHNFSEVAAGAGDGGPLVLPPQPPPNAQSGLMKTWAERRAEVTQAPVPSDANDSLDRRSHVQTPDHATNEVLLGSSDGHGDRKPGFGSAVRTAPSCSALDGAAVFTFRGNTESLLVEDLM